MIDEDTTAATGEPELVGDAAAFTEYVDRLRAQRDLARSLAIQLEGEVAGLNALLCTSAVVEIPCTCGHEAFDHYTTIDGQTPCDATGCGCVRFVAVLAPSVGGV